MSNSTAANSAAILDFDPEGAQRQVNLLVRDGVAWIGDHWIQIGIAIGFAALIVLALDWVKRWGKRYCERQPVVTGWAGIFGRAIARTNRFFMTMIAAKLVVGVADAPTGVVTAINFLFTVAAVFQAAVWVREVILGLVEARTQTDHRGSEALGTALGLIRLLVTFAVFAIALIVVLDNLGVNVTGLVAGLGVGGIAIGLAAQGIFADLFAALSIIFDKPFRKGDSITYDQTQGNIEAIGLKSTRIRSFQGEERIISNKNLLDKEIQNNTQRVHRRAKFAIGVTYQTAPETCARIPDILKEIVEAHDRLFVRAGFVNFGASSLDFEVEFDSPGPDYVAFYDARTAIGIAILRRFNAEGIEIAYPTQTTFTAAPDGRLVMPYAEVQPVRDVDHV
ncbi:mechanosensitive ion channel protein MscS [Sphingomonas spermidinifaciens]|uniref:Mechanosensitive ion channel protein MscS n=1 Tax=Sphingomonas spermidinifaciens TaxID=1141889 RepID=A0A2A4B4L4_9SPHN|nr:mechanosensitive ion channel family protein [Sphingomonas spermidinifaciens]PCD02688.1 mechanosensitive ion channel protein MscS [Sphingomonas spermidinifaciens]